MWFFLEIVVVLAVLLFLGFTGPDGADSTRHRH
jgi:hypothetical protein